MKSMHYMISLWNSRKCGGGGQGGRAKSKEGREEGVIKEHKKTFSSDGYSHYLACSDCFMRICVKTHQTVYFRSGQVYHAKLYLNKTVNRHKRYSLHVHMYTRVEG